MRALPVAVLSAVLALPGLALANESEDHAHDPQMMERYGAHYAHIVFDSGPIEGGARWNHTFYMLGNYTYHCHPHPDMTGIVRVSYDAPPATEPPVVRIRNLTFEPREIAIPPGTDVTFENGDDVMHTVTFSEYDGPAIQREKASPGPTAALALAAALLAAGAGARRILK